MRNTAIEQIQRPHLTQNQLKMKRKTERVEFRLTPETKEDWLRLCELLPGTTQSKAFRFLVFKISNLNELRTILMQDDDEQRF